MFPFVLTAMFLAVHSWLLSKTMASLATLRKKRSAHRVDTRKRIQSSEAIILAFSENSRSSLETLRSTLSKKLECLTALDEEILELSLVDLDEEQLNSEVLEATDVAQEVTNTLLKIEKCLNDGIQSEYSEEGAEISTAN